MPPPKYAPAKDIVSLCGECKLSDSQFLKIQGVRYW